MARDAHSEAVIVNRERCKKDEDEDDEEKDKRRRLP